VSELGRRVAEIVTQAIGTDRLGWDENYLERGVDSITAIRVVARVRKLGVALSIQDVFDCQTVRRLVARVESGEVAPATPVTPVRPFELAGPQQRAYPPGVVDAYPATALQLYMLRESDTDIAQAVYHDVFSYRIALPLDEALLRRALDRLMNAHDTFRTAFSLHGYSVPMQLVFDTVRPWVEVFDVGASGGDGPGASFDAWFEGEKRRGFDRGEPGLVRWFAHRWSGDEFTLTVSFHHAILDGWSLSRAMKELLGRYATMLRSGIEQDVEPDVEPGIEPDVEPDVEPAVAPDPAAPALRYRDYVRAELDARDSAEHAEFWRERLRGHVYHALPRPRANDKPARWSDTVVVPDKATQDALADLSRRWSVPRKHTMLAVHLRVMSLVCAQPDVLTGVFTDGRLAHDESETVPGLYLNFLPFRQRIGGQTWRGLVEETLDNDRRGLPHRRYPLGGILRDLGRERIFETVFNYTRFSAYRDLAEIVTDVRWFEHTDFFLLANVGHDVRQERLAITLNGHGRILPRHRIEAIGELYDAVLRDLVERPEEPVATVSTRLANLVAALDTPAPATPPAATPPAATPAPATAAQPPARSHEERNSR
jgi:aryl carrier-like protein